MFKQLWSAAAAVVAVVVVVVVAFSSLAKIPGEGLTIHSLPARCFFKWISAPAHQFYFSFLCVCVVRISLQWLSELRRLWPNAP